MMEKSTLLIISRDDGQNAYLTHAFQQLRETYNVVFYDVDTIASPFSRSEEILTDLQKKRIKIDGVYGFLDNDVSIAAIIAEKLNLPGPSLKAIYLAQNKELFAKLLHKHKLPYPKTKTINVMSKRTPSIAYPSFIRPVKGSFSADSYMIGSKEEFLEKKKLLSEKTGTVASAYKHFFRHYDQKYEDLDYLFISQDFINAKQYNADGFVHKGKVSLLGITESIYTSDRKSFKRFDFPHRLPQRVFNKLKHTLQKLVTVLEYDDSGFNLEFFITKDKKIVIIEFNTRLSRQFFPLFEQKYVKTPLEILSEVSLRKLPSLTKKTEKVIASSIPLRVFHNAKVISVPSKDELQQLEKMLDIMSINIYVEEGKKLSDYRQDAYSYRYGVADIKGKTLREILRKERKLKEKMKIKFKKI